MNNIPKAYACYNNNLDIRMSSTSGGIFTLIAEYVLEDLGGVVFGAAFDADFNVQHICVDTIEKLGGLRGSKYPQSSLGTSYQKVKKFLLEGRTVLFSGTPCQVQGLKLYLGRDYDNLICIDFVCHGVASRGIWKDYVTWLKKKGIINYIIFKSKVKGWKKWYFRVEYADKIYTHRGGMNSFMRSFLLYCNIRPSCYNCHFKGLNHNSEFTISDCWGIGEQNKELNDDKGLSALLIHNEKANYIFDKIKSKITYREYPAQTLMEGNWTAFESVKPHSCRDDFFALYSKKGGVEAINYFFKPSIKNWLGYYKMRFLGKER